MTALHEEDLLKAFLDEAKEAISDVSYLLVRVEQDQGNEEAVGAVFRHIHSIKGNAPFFGFLKAKTLAHEMENVLQKVRDRVLVPTPKVISILLRGVDELSRILERVGRKQPEVVDKGAFDTLVEEIKSALVIEGTASHKELVALQQLGELKKKLSLVAPQLVEEVNSLITLFSIPEPEPPREGHYELLTELETIIASDGDGRAKGTQIKRILQDIARESGDSELKAIVADALETLDLFMAGIGFDPVLVDMLHSAIKSIRARWDAIAPKEVILEKGVEDETVVISDPVSASLSERYDSVKTMRVREDQVDTFLSYVGELVIVGEMLDHVSDRLQADAVREAIVELRSLRSVFSGLSQSLQSGIMAIRKVPVKGIAQKMPRLVRDIADSRGKEIKVVIIGEELEVDKSLIELIDAPLTHMVRNAADHGIETPEVRLERGKPREGRIEIRFEELDHHIALTIKDDGGGLDLDRITAKAISLGIAAPGATLTEQQVIDFIFTAGVSTAQEVTEISGRGVGMDVVKQMIEASGGSISVTTVQGEGAGFQILFSKSVTTQIMEGFFVEVNGEPYVVPLERVRETFVVPHREVNSMVGRGEFIVRHDEVLPIVPMHTLLGSDGKEREERLMLSVVVQGKPAAFVIDEVIGVHQFVLKEIIGLSDLNPMLTGGALMGDGRIALVVDLPAMVEQGALHFN